MTESADWLCSSKCSQIRLKNRLDVRAICSDFGGGSPRRPSILGRRPSSAHVLRDRPDSQSKAHEEVVKSHASPRGVSDKCLESRGRGFPGSDEALRLCPSEHHSDKQYAVWIDSAVEIVPFIREYLAVRWVSSSVSRRTSGNRSDSTVWVLRPALRVPAWSPGLQCPRDGPLRHRPRCLDARKP